MRETFRGWYKPTEDDLRVLWEDGSIVLDANVLLAPYRLPAGTRARLFNLVEAYQKQIWIPYQAGLEYQQNRLTVVLAQRATYDEIRKELEAAERTLLNRRRDHPVMEPADFEATVQRAVQGIARYIDGAEAGHPEVLGDNRDDDLVRDRWDELLEGRIGERLTVNEEWVKAADNRYDAGTPPGFEDAKKDKDKRARRYGDLILWCELLDHVKSRSQQAGTAVPVIFVTDDAKDDWWRISGGQRLGPRPELVEEIGDAGGKPFWTYSVSRFLLAGSGRLGWEVPAEMTDAVEPAAEAKADVRAFQEGIAQADAFGGEPIEESTVEPRSPEPEEEKGSDLS